MLAVVVGTINSVYKHDAPPKARFYIGNFGLWFALAWLAQDQAELATSIATSYAVFVILGDSGGIIDHFTGRGTSDDTYDTSPD